MQIISIEILRSIAIFGVVGYHLGIPLNSGYLGVDIFFVISGYLVFKKLNYNSDFDLSALSDFLKRRFWRIYPALFLTATMVGFAIIFILSPVQELQVTTKATIFTLFFLGNYFFAKSTGNYFDEFANSLPNLHFWSISVEFQVWVLFAITLFVVKKFYSGKLFNLFFVTIFAVVISFLVLIESYLMNDISQSTRYFYATSSRSIELLVGALVAMIPRKSSNSLALLKFFNIVSILYLLILPAQSNLIHVCLVVWLTAVFIWSNPKISLSKFIKPFVILGSYSYVVYLVHWPVIVLLDRILKFNPNYLIIFQFFSIFLFSLPVKVIESFFINLSKNGFQLSKKIRLRLVIGSLTAVLIILIPGFLAKGGGFNPQVRDIYVSKKRSTEACHNFRNEIVFKKCLVISQNQTSIDYFLIGDSHASTYTDSFLKYALKFNKNIFVSTSSGCPSFPINQSINGSLTDCKSYSDWILEQIQIYQPKAVFMSNRVNNYLNSPLRVAGEERDISKICLIAISTSQICGSDVRIADTYRNSVVQFMNNLPDNTTLYVLFGQPEFQEEFEHCETLFHLEQRCFEISLKDFTERNKPAKNIYAAVDKVRVLDISSNFCGFDSCWAIINNRVLFHDSHHLNTEGANKIFNEHILPLLEKNFVK